MSARAGKNAATKYCELLFGQARVYQRMPVYASECEAPAALRTVRLICREQKAFERVAQSHRLHRVACVCVNVCMYVCAFCQTCPDGEQWAHAM